MNVKEARQILANATPAEREQAAERLQAKLDVMHALREDVDTGEHLGIVRAAGYSTCGFMTPDEAARKLRELEEEARAAGIKLVGAR